MDYSGQYAAIVLSPAAVMAQGSPAGGTTTTTRVDDNDDPDYGWIGLAGLLGLLGLKRKRDDDTMRRDNDATRR